MRAKPNKHHAETETPLTQTVKHWLHTYFSGQKPELSIPLQFTGTSFQTEVWQLLTTVPYGQTRTYNDIAKQIAANKNPPTMYAQAVGHAIGRNPISLLIPCHRVIGSNGKLTSYASGINNKNNYYN